MNRHENLDIYEVIRRAREAFPHAEVGQDNDGQLVIYTGLHPTGIVTETGLTYAPKEKEDEDAEEALSGLEVSK